MGEPSQRLFQSPHYWGFGGKQDLSQWQIDLVLEVVMGNK
jgi:hypothetical protein